MAFLAALPAIAGVIGKIFGGAAGGKSDQRMQENQGINTENLAKANMYGTQQGAEFGAGQLDLQRKQFTDDARGQRSKQAIIADLLSNLQDVSVNVPGIQNAQISGGLRPSAMGATGKQAAGELSKQALMALMQGDTFTGGKLLPPPQLQPLQQAGGLEKFLNIAGLVGSGIGGIGSVLQDDPNDPAKYVPRPGGG